MMDAGKMHAVQTSIVKLLLMEYQFVHVLMDLYKEVQKILDSVKVGFCLNNCQQQYIISYTCMYC